MYPLLVVLLLLLASCAKTPASEDVYTLRVEPDDATPLKDAVYSIQGIMLQDSASGYFPGDLSKVLWQGDFIYVLDSYKAPGLYLYNADGRLLNFYTRRGSGPDEFLNPVDFNVTSSGAVLLDNYSTSHLIYLDKGLSFMRKKAGEEQAVHFFFADDEGHRVWYDRGNVAYGANKDKLVYTSDGKRIPVLPIPADLENVTFASYNSFARLADDTLLYMPVVEPVLYKCYDGHAEVYCKLDFGGLWPTFTDAGTSHPLELMHRIVNEGKIYTANLITGDGGFAVSFFCKKTFYILLFPHGERSSCRLLKVDEDALDSLGPLVAITDGSLVFGNPEKLLKIALKDLPSPE